jgi:hypothetical protein
MRHWRTNLSEQNAWKPSKTLRHLRHCVTRNVPRRTFHARATERRLRHLRHLRHCVTRNEPSRGSRSCASRHSPCDASASRWDATVRWRLEIRVRVRAQTMFAAAAGVRLNRARAHAHARARTLFAPRIADVPGGSAPQRKRPAFPLPLPPGEGRGEGPFPTVFGAACPWHRPPVPGNKRLPLFSFLANRTLTICATPLRKPDLPA